jgi:hypothetical protein
MPMTWIIPTLQQKIGVPPKTWTLGYNRKTRGRLFKHPFAPNHNTLSPILERLPKSEGSATPACPHLLVIDNYAYLHNVFWHKDEAAMSKKQTPMPAEIPLSHYIFESIL